MKRLIPILLMLLVIPVVSASEIQLTPQTFDISLVGGNSISMNITALWTGKTSSVAYSHYELPEGVVIEIQDIFTLEPNTPLSIPVRFIAMPNIAPDNYTVKIWLNTSAEEAVAKTQGIYTGSGGGYICNEEWSCTEWSDCFLDGLQVRTCTDLSNCGSHIGMPTEEQSCIYMLPELPAVCNAGARVCVGDNLMECYEGDNWTKVETCQYGCSNAQCMGSEE